MANASAGVVTVDIDDEALQAAANQADNIEQALLARTEEICATANSYGASFETERTVVWATKEHVGGTQPEYKASIKKSGQGPVGMVVTGNYAAAKDNYLHNTLLKAKG